MWMNSCFFSWDNANYCCTFYPNVIQKCISRNLFYKNIAFCCISPPTKLIFISHWITKKEMPLQLTSVTTCKLYFPISKGILSPHPYYNKDKCVQEPRPKGNNNNFRYFVTCLDGANSETRHGGSCSWRKNRVCTKLQHIKWNNL